jgi:protein ImuA
MRPMTQIPLPTRPAAPARRPAPRRPDEIERLRQQLRRVESGLEGTPEALLGLGIPVIDDALGGGLSGGALHEIAAARETQIAAATSFALGLATRAGMSARTGKPTGRPALWVAEDLSLAENGAPYGPGLDGAGIAPERLVVVAAPRARDLLWVMEEALRCPALGVVVAETREHRLDGVTTRRLALAAAAGNTLGLILRTTPDDAPSAAATRWIIAASSRRCDAGTDASLGPPRLDARLVRNRRGHVGAWMVEWSSVEQRFELAAHSQSMAGAALDRPHRAAVA